MPNALTRSLSLRVATVNYPAERFPPPERMRGRPALTSPECCDGGACAQACPTQAISLEPTWSVDLGKCLFCGLCADVCPSGALELTGDFELAARARADLCVGPSGASATPATGALAPVPRAVVRPSPRGARADESTRLSDQLRERVARAFRRSLHIRHLDAGSCNGCDWELTSLLNPVHDLQRLGFDFVASPRHADLLLVTGAMTRNLAAAALRTYEAMPEPRLVVAVGACGCSGGVFTPNYAGGGGVDTTLPVDVYIPGCPPRPQALLYGLLLAVGRIEQRLGGATPQFDNSAEAPERAGGGDTP